MVMAMREKYQLPLSKSDVEMVRGVIHTMKETYGADLELDDEYTSWIVEAGLLHRYLGVSTPDLEWVGEWFPTVPLREWVDLYIRFIWRIESQDIALIPRVVRQITQRMEQHKYPRNSRFIKILLPDVLASMQTKRVLAVNPEKKTVAPAQDFNTPAIRLSVAHQLQHDLRRIHLTSANFAKRLIILNSIGGNSAYGDAYAVCVRNPGGTCTEFRTKELYLALKLQTVMSRPAAQKLVNEIHFLRWGQQMVQRGICINFPLIYKTVTMPNVVTEKYDMISKKGSLTVGILNELASGDFGHWLNHTAFGYNMLGKFLIQGFMAVHVVQNIWKSYHNDLHIGNLLYNQLEKPRRFVYDVVGRGRFILDNCRFIVKLWDFGEMNVRRPVDALDDVEKMFTSLNEVLMKRGTKMYTSRMKKWIRKMAFTHNVWDVLMHIARVSKDIHFIPWRKGLRKPRTLYYSRIDHFADEKHVQSTPLILSNSYISWTQTFRQLDK